MSTLTTTRPATAAATRPATDARLRALLLAASDEECEVVFVRPRATR